MPKWSDPEEDYQEWGRSLAKAVVNGATTQRGSLELMRALGYGREKLRQWVRRYQQEEPKTDKIRRTRSERRQKQILEDLERADRIIEERDPWGAD